MDRDDLDNIKNKYKIIHMLGENRIFEVNVSEEKEEYFIIEKCDEYFAMALTEKDCREISNFFSDFAELIKCQQEKK